MTDQIKPYAALPLQMHCRAVNRIRIVHEARELMATAILRCGELISGSKAFAQTFSGDTVRLVVLPEYFMTGFPMGESTSEWQEKACISLNGPEYEGLAKVAQDQGVYLSGNAYELDEHFPELYFQTSFIISDTGDVVLRYRRLISMFAATPHDVLSQYLEMYGSDSLFPVADTPFGRLACVASEEILYPEITRALALRGAEVICHSSSEVSGPRLTPKNIAKQARAYENMLYVVSANSAGISGTPVPEASTNGHSQVVNYKGHVLAEARPGESMNGYAEIDIAALRRTRARPAMTNLLARQRLELFAATYTGDPVYPADTLLEEGQVKAPSQDHFMTTQREVIIKLKARGLI
ncbi:MAG TPA: nitrilase-related carbon-nitrogen hydrolase [Xanthomonadales bacterium]|nr:nitrilase-related carbon-nitrogen hydrolase [Xanthomonadales bacterium]